MSHSQRYENLQQYKIISVLYTDKTCIAFKISSIFQSLVLTAKEYCSLTLTGLSYIILTNWWVQSANTHQKPLSKLLESESAGLLVLHGHCLIPLFEQSLQMERGRSSGYFKRPSCWSENLLLLSHATYCLWMVCTNDSSCSQTQQYLHVSWFFLYLRCS